MKTRYSLYSRWLRAAKVVGLIAVCVAISGIAASASAQDFELPSTPNRSVPGFGSPANTNAQASFVQQPAVQQPVRVASRDAVNPTEVSDVPTTGYEIPTPSSVTQNNVNADDGSEVVSSSNAAALSSTGQQIVNSKRLLEVIRGGGPLMIPIGICSIILLVFMFERLVSLRKSRIIPHAFAKRFIEQVREGELDRDKAVMLCDRNDSPLAQVFRAGCLKWGRPSVEVEQAVLDEGERTSNGLRRYLRLINGIATVCPLLGLLGTVLGMIHAFDAIATVTSTTADPKVMIATGISQALLTTAAGMTVAIPALISYLFFSSRVDRHVMEIDQHGQKLVNLISAEAVAASSHTKTKRTRKAA